MTATQRNHHGNMSAPYRHVEYAGMDRVFPDMHRAAAMEGPRVVAYHSGITRSQAELFASRHWDMNNPLPTTGIHKGPEDA